MSSFSFRLASPEALPHALRAAYTGPASSRRWLVPEHMSHTAQTSSKVLDEASTASPKAERTWCWAVLHPELASWRMSLSLMGFSYTEAMANYKCTGAETEPMTTPARRKKIIRNLSIRN